VNDLDKAEFGTQLTHFGVIHKFTVTPVVRQSYWEDLKDMSRANFDRACIELRRTSQWFPKPFQFRQAARKGWM
jgi:hypothetical protein